MARRLSTALKIKLSEALVKWYRTFGKVAARKPYHDEGGDAGDAAATMVFESHPLLANMPIGAPSDLAWVDNNNNECIEEAVRRGEELTNQPRARLEMRLGQKLDHRKKYLYEQFTKPTAPL